MTAPHAVESLRQRVLRAGSWTIGANVIGQLIRLGSNLLLTRLLVPDAFGLVAAVSVVMVGLALFSDVGISQNVVRSPRGEDPDFLHTAWTLQILRGLLIFSVALLAAWGLLKAAHLGWLPAGSVYADPQLPALVAVAATSAVIQGFVSMRFYLARRHMRARLIAQINLACQVVSFIVVALAAWWWRSVWALVAGGVFAVGMHCMLTHLALPGPKDRLQWDRACVAELIGFGKWIFLSSIVGFLVMNGDRILLGSSVGATIFGIYTVAFMLVAAFQSSLLMLISSVVYPALSQVARDRPQDLGSVANKFQRHFDWLLMGVAGLLIMAGPSIVAILYDSRYQTAGTILSVLAIGIIGMRYAVTEQCYLALGSPQILTATNVCRLAALYCGFPLAFAAWGFLGGLLAIAASSFAGWPLAIFFKLRYRMMDARVELMALLPLMLGLALGAMVRWVVGVEHSLEFPT